MSSVELTELVYSDLYFDKKCDVERCIQLIDLYFNGPDTVCLSYIHHSNFVVHTFQISPFQELLEKQVRHRESLRCRVIPHTTTAWNFLNVVRPDDVDGVGLEFAGKRVWDLFWTAAERVAGSSEQ